MEDQTGHLWSCACVWNLRFENELPKFYIQILVHLKKKENLIAHHWLVCWSGKEEEEEEEDIKPQTQNLKT